MLLRPGERDDLVALSTLSGSTDRAHARLRAAAAGDEALLVAQHGQVVAGAVSVRWQAACDAPHPWLYALHVRPDARRHGFDTLLVAAAETVASLAGAGAVSLDVDADDGRLMAWYGRLGYARVAPHRHHWRSVDATGTVTADGVADTGSCAAGWAPPGRRHRT